MHTFSSSFLTSVKCELLTMTRRSCISAHVLCQGLLQIRTKNRLLIGSAQTVPLTQLNRLHAWTCTCPTMGLRALRLFGCSCHNRGWASWAQPLLGCKCRGTCSHWLRRGVMAPHQGPRLLDFTKTPQHLQFNKYVLTGYRPVSTAPECLRSLFYMHNELGNIYTHGMLLKLKKKHLTVSVFFYKNLIQIPNNILMH